MAEEQWGLLERSVPAPPAGTRFSKADRELCIRSHKPLPPAFRVPTELSLTYYVRRILCEPSLLATLIEYRDKHPVVIKVIVESLNGQTVHFVPRKHRKTLRSALAATLRNGAHGYYSLEATAQRLLSLDYEECCARDHYLRGAFFKRFHAYVIYRYIRFVETKDAHLRAATESTSVCAVCQHQAARRHEDGGERVVWRQAEPCRHWICDACTRDLIARGIADHCCLCRTKVMTYAIGIAPAANR